jgi:hypothetical protein
MLGASFFVSRQVSERHHAPDVLCSIAHQLVKQLPAFSDALSATLRDSPELASSEGLQGLVSRLLFTPAASLVGAVRVLIVIDAIDECTDCSGGELLPLLLRGSLQLSGRVKLFLTSRADPKMIHMFDQILLNASQGFVQMPNLDAGAVDSELALLHSAPGQPFEEVLESTPSGSHASLSFPPAFHVLFGRLGYIYSQEPCDLSPTVMSFAEACAICGYPLPDDSDEHGVQDASERFYLFSEHDRQSFTRFISDLVRYGSSLGKEKDLAVKVHQQHVHQQAQREKRQMAGQKLTTGHLPSLPVNTVLPSHRKHRQRVGGQIPPSSGQPSVIPASDSMPSSSMWAFHPNNFVISKERLIMLEYLSLEKWWFPRASQPVWMLDEIASPRRLHKWVLVLHDPHVVVDVLSHPSHKTLEDITTHCFETGIRFDTVQRPEVDLCVPDEDTLLRRAEPSLVGARDDSAQFEDRDFEFYEQQMMSLLTRSPHVGRAAAARGGISAAIARHAVSLRSILQGPSEHALMLGVCEVFQAANGDRYVNDALLPQEVDLIAGVWSVRFSAPVPGQTKQRAYPSYFPQSEHWMHAGYDVGSWSPLGTRLLQKYREEYSLGQSQPRRQDVWKNNIRTGVKGLRQAFFAARMGAEALLDAVIASQLMNA